MRGSAARGRAVSASVLLACLAVGAGCGGRKIHHEVRPGETLYRIGVAYGMPYEEITRANRITDPARIYVGQQLVIPGAKEKRRVAAAPAPRAVRRNDAAAIEPRDRGGAAPARSSPAPRRELTRDAPRLAWPVPLGTLSSRFGPRAGSTHDGIDISAPEGAEVHAAAEGEVVYSSSLPGYGNVIIVRHPHGYATVYAHNQKHRVEEGQRVRRGQAIATVGRSGRTTGPNLHFELRKDNVARDPLDYLPGSLQADLIGRSTAGGG